MSIRLRKEQKGTEQVLNLYPTPTELVVSLKI